MDLTDSLRRLVRAASSLVSDPFLVDNVAEIPPEDLIRVWSLLDHVVRRLEHRKSVLRARILDYAKEHGVTTEKGGSVLVTGPLTVLRKVSGGNDYDIERVKRILAQRQVGPDTVLTTRTRVEVVVDASKIAKLHETGWITDADVAEMKKPPTVALDVFEPEDYQKALEGEGLTLLAGMKRKGVRGDG